MTNVSSADIINITVADITADVITTTDITAGDRKERVLMKCPVCGKEMEKGRMSNYMRSCFGEKVFWAPDEFFEKSCIGTKKDIEKSGGTVFPLNGYAVFSEPRYSWYCRECEIVVLNIKK